MRRLSAQDAAFLYLETPQTPMHVGSVTLFAPTDVAPDLIYERFRVYTAARLDLLPSYWRRLQTTFGITQPFWVHARKIDLDYHFRRHTLPPPGTMEQLRELVAELHAKPLDRTRPLWEYHLIEGLETGGFAVQMKVHHALMDGVIGTAALSAILDASADGPAKGRPHSPWEEHEVPGLWTAAGGVMNAYWEQVALLGRVWPRLASAVAGLGQSGGAVRQLLGAVRVPPRTLLNVSISGNRSCGLSSAPLAEAKRVAKARHVTINDIVLSVCGGALRRYLAEKKALPKQALVAGIPMTLRDQGDQDYDNESAAYFCTLATDHADPLERLSAIAAASHTMQDQFRHFRDIYPTDLIWPGLPLAMNGLFQFAARARVYDVLPPFMNVVISNVPGPREPLYCAGIQAVRHFPLSIAYHNAALNITVVSYVDGINFGLIACRDVVPDVQHIADLIVEEFDALKRAALATEVGFSDMVEIDPAPLSVAPKLAGPEAAVPDAAPAGRPARKRKANGRIAAGA